MANIFEGGGGGQYSIRPPRAPVPAMLRARMRGNLGGRARLGGVARLKEIMRRRLTQRGPGQEGGDFRDWLVNEGQLNQPQQPAPPADFNPLEGMPTDFSSLGAVQWGPTAEPWHDRDPQAMLSQRVRGFAQQRGAAQQGSPDDDIRARLFERYSSAVPQQPALTSRRALQGYLQAQPRQRARKPMLPLRRPLPVRRPY